MLHQLTESAASSTHLLLQFHTSQLDQLLELIVDC